MRHLSVFMELIRIIFLFGLLGGLAWELFGNIYSVSGKVEEFRWLGGIAIYLALFVLYRNKLQFSGWYKGNGRVRLSRPVTWTLLASGVFLFILPFLLAIIVS
ncbi:hypothetical protein [Sediminibacillus albus]|uniref:Uncharacterized protein n=1 Tax=Sediminibacillus albus TaxID=407036 RepID=A0A1G8WRP7_9BACI|nr:hypothetical protein [Sediminibacillus albus]SDJ80871.1 hypothetical protein SAMN05216243_0955 [Sediminibacillus albus]